MTAWALLVERRRRWWLGGAVAALLVGAAWRATRPPAHLVAPPHVEASPELPPWFGHRSRPDARIAGQVWHDGAPLAALVYLRIDAPDPTVWRGRMLPTLPDGHFDFGMQRPGPYQLLAVVPGLTSRVVEIDTSRDDASALDVFAYRCTTRRRIVRFGDLPVEGATVEVGGVVVATTDARGRFEICPPADSWEITVRARGLRAEVAFPYTHDDIELHAPMTISGRVVDDDGAPVAGAMVHPTRETGPEDEQTTFTAATTDDAGRFAVEVPAGTYAFDVRRGIHPFHDATTRFAGEREILIRIGPRTPPRREQLPPPPTVAIIRGRVMSRGRPVADASVSASVGCKDLGSTHARRDGSFELSTSADGMVCVIGMSPDALEAELLGADRRAFLVPGEDLGGVDLALRRVTTDGLSFSCVDCPRDQAL